jgi:uncharacterized damage-inducible protein DinB
MLSTNDLIEALARNVSVVKMQTQGLTHADTLIQPPFGGNCLNWVLGHIVENRDRILELIGAVPLMGEPGVRYKRGSEPMKQAEPTTLPLEEILAHLDRSQEQLAAALDKMEDAAWAREMTVGNNRTMKLGQRVFFLYFHETYHVGQTELFRQLAGKHDKII